MLAGLDDGEGVAGVAGIACRRPVYLALLLELGDFLFALEADLVAAAAPLHAVGQDHGHGVGGGHGLEGRPGEGVFAALVLGRAFVVALAAGVGGGKRDLVEVVALEMVGTVAVGAADVRFAVFALAPVGDDVGAQRGVTIEALHGAGLGGNKQKQRNGEDGDYSEHCYILPSIETGFDNNDLDVSSFPAPGRREEGTAFDAVGGPGGGAMPDGPVFAEWNI